VVAGSLPWRWNASKLLLPSHFTSLLLSLHCLDELPNGVVGSAKIQQKSSMPALLSMVGLCQVLQDSIVAAPKFRK
jgi:hypothetical protein